MGLNCHFDLEFKKVNIVLVRPVYSGSKEKYLNYIKGNTRSVVGVDKCSLEMTNACMLLE